MNAVLPLVTGFGGVVLGYVLKTGTDLLTEKRRARREFEAAVLLVDDELQANIVNLGIALGAGEKPEPLASQAYDAYQLILAKRLSPEARDAVRGAYIHVRVPRAFQVKNAQGHPVGTTGVVGEAHAKAKHARELLRRYIPEGTAEI